MISCVVLLSRLHVYHLISRTIIDNCISTCTIMYSLTNIYAINTTKGGEHTEQRVNLLNTKKRGYLYMSSIHIMYKMRACFLYWRHSRSNIWFSRETFMLCCACCARCSGLVSLCAQKKKQRHTRWSSFRRWPLSEVKANASILPKASPDTPREIMHAWNVLKCDYFGIIWIIFRYKCYRTNRLYKW